MATDPRQYGRSFADVYDEWYSDVSDVSATVAALATTPGPLLELGSGTGRLALPLAEAGRWVIALDVSPEMHEKLRDRRGRGVTAVEADMTVLPLADGSVSTVLVAFNTICNLASVTGQARCLAEAARVLRPGGTLVVESFVPPPLAIAPERAVSTRSATSESVVLTATERGDEPRHIVGRHVELRESGGVRERPWELRAVTVEELDAMAAEVGLVLAQRHGDWRGAPFLSDSEVHVSTYARPR